MASDQAKYYQAEAKDMHEDRWSQPSFNTFDIEFLERVVALGEEWEPTSQEILDIQTLQGKVTDDLREAGCQF